MNCLHATLFSVLFAPALALAVEHNPPWVEDKDGVMISGEYEVIDQSGATTRALCPYTCADRKLPTEHCKTWKSEREPEKCYVQDTRKPSRAINFGTK